ncbi:MAG: tRNA (adenosine(37)-N6)-threonylcarbamoyltransferase complex transferase subunit TsaD [Candidatus Moranbacteria bacterium]|nr:tRNA (adenosine(37)-N6)-threonylcarbamoyltransferase complex transferase subunit TsaD [Candidatus Moranbacteria bacterium]
MKILGLESSCDETAASVVEIDETNGSIKPLSNVISSQIKLHAKWGGVVPNLAAREHLKNILPVIESGLAEAGVSKDEIDLIAVTHGPGLIPALLVGTNTAKTLSLAWEKPLLGIHHIEGHIYANFINKKDADIKFPALCLVVSGGHTQLVLMKKHLTYEIIGETQDDAVGEAFDKVARILGLGYPGGPAVASAAATCEFQSFDFDVHFPRPMLKKTNFDFSFSGLKTAVLYFVKKNPKEIKNKKFIAEVAYEFQQAAVEVLVTKTIRAAKKYSPKTILLAGGVSANTELQTQLTQAIEDNLSKTNFSFPEIAYQLDNATMIATAAYFRHKALTNKKSLLSTWKNLQTKANLELPKK